MGDPEGCHERALCLGVGVYVDPYASRIGVYIDPYRKYIGAFIDPYPSSIGVYIDPYPQAEGSVERPLLEGGRPLWETPIGQRETPMGDPSWTRIGVYERPPWQGGRGLR